MNQIKHIIQAVLEEKGYLNSCDIYITRDISF